MSRYSLGDTVRAIHTNNGMSIAFLQITESSLNKGITTDVTVSDDNLNAQVRNVIVFFSAYK